MTVEAETWLAAQPKNPNNGKVDIAIVIAEGERRGYCICPKPIRQMVSMVGFKCAWCKQIETQESWNFWYLEVPS